MISKIRGTVEQILDHAILVEVGGVSYEVLIPAAVLKSFDPAPAKGSGIQLVTYHYYQTDPSKSIPILIGFSNSIEKDFFEKFITVSGVGPKAAVRALIQPIPEIARAIDEGDQAMLKSLPGIGEQRAREIIAKLQGRMGRFGLMRDGAPPVAAKKPDRSAHLREEAIDVLLQLQYKKEEARRMIEKAFARQPDLATVEEILNEVYRQKKSDS